MMDAVLGSIVLVTLTLGLAGIVSLARRVMNPARPANLTVNEGNRIATETGRKLLWALLDNGILVPSACAGAGTCGLCRVQIVGDGPPPLPVEAARLTAAELRSGTHLACQVTLRGDLSVRVADDLLAAEAFEARVISVTAMTPLIREIVLAVPQDRDAQPFAGAFIQITAPPAALDFRDFDMPDRFSAGWDRLRRLTLKTTKATTRAYSIANRPRDTRNRRIVLNIRLALPPPRSPYAPPGIVSSWLFSLRPGDMVPVSGPFGAFRVQDTSREMVFLGGGVGMAPLRAMIFDLLEGRGSKRKITFWYGARSLDDLYYGDEFDALAAAHENFDWTVALSDLDDGAPWDGDRGFIHRVAWERYLRDHPAPQDCEYYLCGPPMMIAAVLRMLDELGVEPTQIFNDDFGV